MMQLANTGAFFKEIYKTLAKLIIAGVFIGLFKSYDGWVAVVLLLKILHVLYITIVTSPSKNWMLLIGMILSGAAGVIAEHWGVRNGYWEYHEVAQKLPLWLPFAWALAFYVLYKIEVGLIQHIKHKTTFNKVMIAFWVSLIVPALGEMITIYLGVWTYYWEYQILGVPLLALACLVTFHMSIYLVLAVLCRSLKIKDPVF